MRIEALEAWFREGTGFFVFYLLVPPWLYLFSLVVYHLLSFLTTEGLRDHWGGNPGDKSGAFVISSGSLWEMKTITKNKYFCQDKGHKHLGGRGVYKDGRSGPKISSGSEYITTGCMLDINELDIGPIAPEDTGVFFFTLSWKAWVNVGIMII